MIPNHWHDIASISWPLTRPLLPSHTLFSQCRTDKENYLIQIFAISQSEALSCPGIPIHWHDIASISWPLTRPLLPSHTLFSQCRTDKENYLIQIFAISQSEALSCPGISIHWHDIASVSWPLTRPLLPSHILFWYASVAYQARLVPSWVFWAGYVSPKYQTRLICCRRLQKHSPN